MAKIGTNREPLRNLVPAREHPRDSGIEEDEPGNAHKSGEH
jgi:hypothetical protein